MRREPETKDEAKEKTDFYWTNVLISISVKDSLLILIIVQHASISYCSLIPLSVNSASLSRFLGSKAPSAYSNESVRKRRRNGVREAGEKNITFLIEIIRVVPIINSKREFGKTGNSRKPYTT